MNNLRTERLHLKMIKEHFQKGAGVSLDDLPPDNYVHLQPLLQLWGFTLLHTRDQPSELQLSAFTNRFVCFVEM